MQAAFLRIKLHHLAEYNVERNIIAQKYLNGITNPKIKLPVIGEFRTHVWHIFPIMCEDRDAFCKHLADHGVGTVIHYPIAIADQIAYEKEQLPKLPMAEYIAKSEVSLPLYIGMTDDEINYVIDVINKY